MYIWFFFLILVLQIAFFLIWTAIGVAFIVVGKSKNTTECVSFNLLIYMYIFSALWIMAFIVINLKKCLFFFSSVGAINLNNCLAQRYIPIYMIVAGAFSFAYWIVLLLNCFCPTLGKIFAVLVGLFVFAWFIAGRGIFIVSKNSTMSCLYTHTELPPQISVKLCGKRKKRQWS